LPAAWQLAAAHFPAVQVALQQSLDSEQFWPALRHASPSQTPAEHDMLQQSLYEEHEAPPARHLPAGPESLLPESPPPLPPSAPELPPLPLPPSGPPKPFPLPWAPLLPAHPSPATTNGSTARTTKIAQERLTALRTTLISPSPRHKAVGTLQSQATPAPI
jgi:hypothetical protein